jgi:hypothetical protein
MKKSNTIRKISMAVALTFMALGFAAAAESQTTMGQSGDSAIVRANNEVGAGATGTLMNYQEHINPGPSDIESGWMPGFDVKYSVMGDYFSSLPRNLYFAVHYQYASGGIAYHGAIQRLAGSIPADSTDNATTNRVVARLGEGFSLAPDMMLTPYLAGGYQDWSRNIAATSQAPESGEFYSTGLVGAGALFQYAPTTRLVLGADAEAFATVGGGMTPTTYPGNLLGSAGFGTSGEERIALNADYRVIGSWHLYGGLNLTHFNYTGGALGTAQIRGLTLTGREPSSSTNLFGMDLGVAYAF